MEKITCKIVVFVCALMLPMYFAVPARAEDKKVNAENAVPAHEAAGAEAKPAPQAGAGEVVIGLNIPLLSPLFSEVPLAKVNDETVTVKEIRDAVIASHEERTEEKAAQKINYVEILDRLINSKLILQEARGMGIDELPDIKEAISAYGKEMRKNLLLMRATKNAKADPAEVDKIYKDMIREWKIKSVLFFQEEDAKKMLEGIKAGKSFDELAEKAVADKKAKGNLKEDFIGPANLLPQVTQAVASIKIGSVTPVVKILAGKENSGYAVLKLVDVRYVDNKEAKEKAEQESLQHQKAKMIQEYGKTLIKKYDVKVNKQLLKQLDFTAKKPGIEKLSQDRRVLAVIKGEKPITIGVVTVEVKKSFFHGLKEALAENRVNDKKFEVLEGLIDKALEEKEAAKQGLDKTDEYKNMMKEYGNSVIFGTFIEKVIAPDVKLTKEEIETYYKEHISEYTTPAMISLDGLAFAKKEDAENAIEKLRKGTDYNWLVSNAEGQVKKDAKNLLSFEGNLLTVKSMPEGLQKVLAGAKEDEVKLYASPDGYYYVVVVKHIVAPESKPLSEVQQDIAGKVYGGKLKDSVEEYAAKLRKAGDVRIYLSKTE
ncbi:MAG: peptidyl-prolyl cis-trans isomerase [Dissulfurispiraceae bacterium]